MDQNNKEDMLKKVLALGAVTVVIVAVATMGSGFSGQPASSLSSKVAQNARNLTQAPVEKMSKEQEAFFKKPSKNPKPAVVSQDPTLDAEITDINTPKNEMGKNAPSLGLSNKYTNWGVVSYTNPTAKQSAFVSGTELHTVNRIMVAAPSWPVFINPDELRSTLLGTKSNPMLPQIQWYYWYNYNRILSTSTNVTSTPVDFYDDQHVYQYTQNLLMIPANQTAMFKLETIYDTSILYPDSYSSNIPILNIAPVWFNTGTQSYEGSYKYSGNNIPTQPNQTNKVNVIGETSPYITNWPTDTLGINDTITLEGYRFGSNVTVKIQYWDNLSGQNIIVPDFTLPTIISTFNRKAVSFSLAGQNINLGQLPKYILLQVSDVNGKNSNTIFLEIQ